MRVEGAEGRERTGRMASMQAWRRRLEGGWGGGS